MSGSDITGRSPLIRQVDLLSIEVLVDGAPLRDNYIVQSVNIHRKINKISTAEFTFLDGDPTKVNFELEDEEVVVPGKSIVIKAGYHQDNNKIFEGVILKVGISIKPGGHSEITCFCTHKAQYLTIGRQNKYFIDKKDDEIISEIISDYGLPKSVESTKIKHSQIIQYGCCDWDFILSRLEQNGLILLTDDDKVKVKKPDFNSAPVHLLTHGVEIIKSELEIDGSFQLKKVKTISWNPDNQELNESVNRDVSINLQGNSGQIEFSVLADKFNKKDFLLQSTGHLPEKDLEEWATSQFQRAKMSRTLGSITCNGTEKFLPDKIVELKGLGKWFDGKAYIREVNHVLQSGSWITELIIGWQKDWYLESRTDIINPATSGQLPAMEGIFIGKVKQLEGDPEGGYRIKLDIPVITGSSDGVWARLAQLQASDSHGAYYVPEIDDEVVVGFLNADSRYPVILGSLYSSKLKSPYEHEDINKIKGFVSRSELKLTYHEEDKSITLETPGGRKFTIDDTAQHIKMEDGFNNSITMDASGITIKTTGRVEIDATMGVQMTGSAMVKMDSSGPISVSGTLVNINGNVSAMVSAPTATLSGQMIATVTGAIVIIG